MKINEAIEKGVRSVVEGFALNKKMLNEDTKAYFESLHRDFILLPAINCREYMSDKNSVAVEQLNYSKAVIVEMQKLAAEVVRVSDINCYPSEITKHLEGFFCEYINAFCMIDSGATYDNNELISRYLSKAIRGARGKLLKKREYYFPCKAMGLTASFSLSPSVSVVLASDEDLEMLSDREKERYSCDRHFMFNAYIKITLSEKVSPKLGFDIAKKASLFTANLININAHSTGLRHSPCILADAKTKNSFDFYHATDSHGDVSKCVTDRFLYNGKSCEEFWDFFLGLLNNEKYKALHDVLSETMELCVKGGRQRRVVDLLIDAVNWYGDAFSESSNEARVVKCVTAIESIINYGDGDKVMGGDAGKNITSLNKIFTHRVCKIHKVEISSDIGKQADSIYEARSQVVHGSRLTEILTDSPLAFCCETLCLAIPLLYKFGLNTKGYKKSLAEYIDNLDVIESPTHLSLSES